MYYQCHKALYFGKKLYTGTVPVLKTLYTGTVPVLKTLYTGTVPVLESFYTLAVKILRLVTATMQPWDGLRGCSFLILHTRPGEF